MFRDGTRRNCIIYVAQLSWLGYALQYADPAQPLTAAVEELDDLGRDLSDPFEA